MAEEVKLPTAEDIHRLPRWARVAFAARCARRALPLFRAAWPAAPAEHLRAVERAVLVAEQVATDARPVAADAADHRATAADPVVTADAAPAAADAVSSSTADASADTAAADAAAADAYAAAAAADAAAADVAAAAARAAYAAAYAASAYAAADAAADDDAAAAAAYAADARTRVIPNIVKDFQSILRLSREQGWTDNTSVSPEVFSPLDDPATDPLSAPPLEQDPEVKFALRAVTGSGVSAEVVARHVVAVFQALNEYTLAKYGTRLTKDQFRRLVYAHSGARV
jgi:hypothetical protein